MRFPRVNGGMILTTLSNDTLKPGRHGPLLDALQTKFLVRRKHEKKNLLPIIFAYNDMFY